MAVQGKENVVAFAAEKREICSQMKQMVVDQLCLDIDPGFITNDQPLFGRGLELDSIDSLELSVGVFNLYQLSLADYVIAHRVSEDGEGGADLSGGMDLG